MDNPLTAGGVSASSFDPQGILLRGITVVSKAYLLTKRDGSGKVVKIVQDLLSGSALARVETFLDPADPRLKIEGDEVLDWPKLPKFAHAEYLVERFGTEDGKTMIVRQGKLLRVAEGAFGVLASSREASRCQPAAQG
jgi:hypothetical protein